MSVAQQFQKLEAHASSLIIGQAHLINRMLIALLCDGHLGKLALLLRVMGGEMAGEFEIYVETELVVRGTTAAPY